MVAEDFLQDPQVREWLDGVEPAWTLMTFESLRALRHEPSALCGLKMENCCSACFRPHHRQGRQSRAGKDPSRVLRARREGPRRRAAERDDELPPSDMDCHMTLPWGSCNGEDDITPGRAALRDFKPAYDCSGVRPWGRTV